MADDGRQPPPLDYEDSDEEQEEAQPPKVEEPMEEIKIEQKEEEKIEEKAPVVVQPEPEPAAAKVDAPVIPDTKEEKEEEEENVDDLFASAKESAGMQSVSSDQPSEIPITKASSFEPPTYALPENNETEKFDISIEVSDPHKVGEGINAYMSYKVRTRTSMPSFKRPDGTVSRRFSDFLGLHEKLVGKHRPAGRIVPPAPEKSIVGMTLVKMSKTEEEATAIDFVEKRRAALERYLNKIAEHPSLIADQDFHDFLEQPDLPQATNTRALSGAGVMRLVKNVEGAFNKITIRMTEEDSWFEEKQQQIESLEQQLKKLHSAFDGLVHHKKELAVNTASFAKSSATLGNAEEHTALSRALAQLSDTYEKIEAVYNDQSNSDYYGVAEKFGDYLRVITEIKEVFMIRIKSWQNWQTNDQSLQRKKESEAKLQAAGKMDKISQVQSEIKELESRVETSKKDFDELSNAIKSEIQRFEKDRITDFRQITLLFLQTLMKSQEQAIKHWEGFMPEARAIA